MSNLFRIQPTGRLNAGHFLRKVIPGSFSYTNASTRDVVVTADKRDTQLTGAANNGFDFSIKAYRIVDADINASQIIYSPVATLPDNTYFPTKNFNKTLDISKGQINSSNISSYLANAAIGSAQIMDASITSAKIGKAEINTANIANAAIKTTNIEDANITTLKVQGGAITVPLSAYTAGSIGVPSGVTFTTIQTLVIPSISSTESTVLIVNFGAQDSGVDPTTEMLLTDGITTYFDGPHSGGFTITITLPPLTSKTLSLNATGGPNCTVVTRFITVMGSRR